MQATEYSIVVPVYNSAATLEELVARIRAVMAPYSAELILVDDGSTDESWKTIRQLAGTALPLRVRGIRLAKNFGQQNATLCGLRAASGQFAVTIDDDLQSPPEEIPVLIGQIQRSMDDVVYGKSEKKRQPIIRHTLRAVLYKWLRYSGFQKSEYSSFRIINRRTLDNLNRHFTFFVSIDEIIGWYTIQISSVQVEHLPRKSGSSNYSLFRLVTMSLKIFFGYYDLPLKIIIGLGFYVALGSFLLGVMFFVKKVFFGAGVEGWTSLMVSLMFSTGIITFSLGLVAKYLLHIITLQNGKPGYTIGDEVG